MNTYMWKHPLTAQHLNILTELLGYKIISPIEKTLVCGDTGQGAMAETHEIAKLVFSLWKKTKENC
jgi:phosphopantothenoylcysteine decarboxylase